ncbi:UDP-glucose/GDP-mannose dehydrogenase family protein [Aeromonas hydrophila]|uniref:UDP-glucose dehydrogenase family protein n=1 Tax=Aeromonas hydrophila TaxID=644 RepID=UPI001C5B10BC|nr:UDP-glucose/GDP-mannose dehydrogenase family protein [Aeromonas hydrophila]MBW3811426.1 UDP-glucose/GDP-mannose dehydrogenase family protein [Aeromonas hydrophila]
MNITVFGSGYVGLVQATVLADVGHQVICVDVDEQKVAALMDGQVPIYEPGLESLLQRNIKSGSLVFTTDAVLAVKHGDVQFLAVGTPPGEDGSADLSHVLTVAETIAQYRDRPVIIVNKSTVPVGTADKVTARVNAILQQRDQSFSFDVVSNPEFLKEGSAIQDCLRPDRIVVGTANEASRQLMRELYEPFNRNHDRILFMDVRSAELTKYAANCMLATKISFINEMAGLAERVGADIEMVRQGIGSDQRIGYQFIYPGCGYGGSCFPKDVKALLATAQELEYDTPLIRAVERVNELQKSRLFQLLSAFFHAEGESLAGKTIALWGLAFKPNTDDMREAPSRALMEALWQAGATVQAYDPEAMQEAQQIYGNCDKLRLMGTKEAALFGADALVICTEWNHFKAPNFAAIKQALHYPLIVDGRNLFDPGRMKDHGFHYYAIGRGESVMK